jgi:DNA mismatch repair protein MutS2
MLSALPGRALILLDELGTATDPTEGGALALALLQAFYRRGAYGAVTTHLPLLKSFAQQNPGFENVAVIFNEETRRPTYRLTYGVAGASNALKIARELGLSPEILEQAEGYLDQEELRAYRLLSEVEAAREHLAHREGELACQQEELERRSRELEATRQDLEAEKRRLAAEVRAMALERIKKAEGEFKEILNRLQQPGLSWGKLRQEFSQRQAQLLQDLTPKAHLAPVATPEYRTGQKVFLPALGLYGEIQETQTRDGRLEVQVRKVKLRVSPEELTLLSVAAPGTGAAGKVQTHFLPPERMPSLNLVGLRVDEALPLVDRLLDQAVLNGQEKVDIIHGVGTGRLKRAIWDHLQHHTQVKALHGDDNPGVTVVDLKE